MAIKSSGSGWTQNAGYDAVPSPLGNHCPDERDMTAPNRETAHTHVPPGKHPHTGRDMTAANRGAETGDVPLGDEM